MKKSIKKNSKSTIIAVAAFVSRLGYLPANISPLGSFGFFGKNKWLFFATIIIFDWLVGGFYPGFWVTYLGFAMYPLLGRLARSTRLKLTLLPLASFSFFLISNFGVWWYWYPHTITGLTTCYLLAVPFYKQTLIGDLVFGYGYLLVKKCLANLSDYDALLPLQPLPQP
ncbi:MAG: hypothetical protein HN846_03910 [Candidatus Pacebacteria bacterium]|jgi:hypothetical protein|nr:hypothetical protein [Candidatus Paceibacterota bacterium]MBT3511670.1 hypothetical protein [Candidatus Paceibacterota bacterium]MBT4004630.1 hypothetical protein [Candidatus Paceibacterota bacterium]MBT4358813.1 hypothetical protein [Candidatus Paceibacterota bacterium]MBT4680637.1 hypothetical protein [Candidatus Paceibacterota bacterium]